MKNITLSLALLFSVLFVSAQNNKGKSDDSGRLGLATFIPKQDGLNDASHKFLSNKLNSIASKNGMGGSPLAQRFIISASCQVITKDITPTAPPMHAYTLEVTFYIGDGVDGTLFSSTTMTFKGVDRSETKAYRNALKRIRVTDKRFADFITEGKTKIIEYYNSQCDFLLKEALTKAGAKEYDDAMTNLAAVPDVCKECYMKAQDTLVHVFKLKVENECQEKIAAANVSIAKEAFDEAAGHLNGVTPDLNCFKQAKELLAKIEAHKCAEALGQARAAWAQRDVSGAAGALAKVSANSACAQDAEALNKEIASKVDADEKRDFEQMQKEQQDAVDLEKASISAARDAAVAYAKNQPKTITYKSIW